MLWWILFTWLVKHYISDFNDLKNIDANIYDCISSQIKSSGAQTERLLSQKRVVEGVYQRLMNSEVQERLQGEYIVKIVKTRGCDGTAT